MEAIFSWVAIMLKFCTHKKLPRIMNWKTGQNDAHNFTFPSTFSPDSSNSAYGTRQHKRPINLVAYTKSINLHMSSSKMNPLPCACVSESNKSKLVALCFAAWKSFARLVTNPRRRLGGRRVHRRLHPGWPTGGIRCFWNVTARHVGRCPWHAAARHHQVKRGLLWVQPRPGEPTEQPSLMGTHMILYSPRRARQLTLRSSSMPYFSIPKEMRVADKEPSECSFLGLRGPSLFAVTKQTY